MELNLFNDREWQKLVRIIERGKCVLMLGADIPSGEDNNLPSLNTLFARKLAKDTAGKAKICNEDDLPHVSQTYLNNKIGDRDDLEMAAEDFYREFHNQTTRLHKALAQLPFRYYISITPDELMTNALKSDGIRRTPKEDFYHFRPGCKELSFLNDLNTPLVYKLYGSVTDSRSLVLTESDLLDFLANIISSCPELPPALSTLFRDKETSFLFVGFGFQHWYLRILLHLFRKSLNTSTSQTSANNIPRSIALENSSFFADPMLEQTALFYDHTHSIEFKHCSWDEFAQQLLRRYKEKAAIATKTVVEELPEDAPTVFLCHSSANSDAVGELGQKLRSLGLNTWRDRDNLRGGDSWNKRINHVIENQIDYLLVLQTPEMLAASQSYFIEEIKCALARQKQNWSEYLFLVPAILSGDSNKKLEALTHLNYRDLRQDKELELLVREIKADQQKRKQRKESAHAN